MLTYSMEDRKGLSLYEYLYQCIKNDILSGRLDAGERLPSKRNLAKNLGISVITVENSYSQLIAEGFIYSAEKKGYYVAELTKWTKESVTLNYNSVKKQKSERVETNVLAEQSKFKIDFVNNAVNYDKFPFSQWSKLTREILSIENEELLKRAPAIGVLELREAIAEYLINFRGIDVGADRIVIGSGTEYLYSLTIQLLGRDKTYALEDPGYSKVTYVFEGSEVSCVHVPLDEQGMQIGPLLESEADIVHLTPAHHFPTGIVMPIQRRLEFLDWVEACGDRYIIEDDYDCEFRLHGKPIQTLFGSGRSNRIIYMNTFSKTLAPSFRISYMVLPQYLIERFHKQLDYISCTVPNLEQYVLAQFMKRGYFERHINRMRVFYRTQRNILLDAIAKSDFSDSVSIREEDSGLHFLLKVKTNMTDAQLVSRARTVGIKVSCLSDYQYNNNADDSHVLIINYSGIEQELIKHSVGLLGEVIANS